MDELYTTKNIFQNSDILRRQSLHRRVLQCLNSLKPLAKQLSVQKNFPNRILLLKLTESLAPQNNALTITLWILIDEKF